MRIGMNLLFMVPGEVGGSEPLLVNLVRALATTDNELLVYAVRGFSRAYPDLADQVQVLEAPWSSGAQGLRIAAEHTWLAASATRRRLDVLHHGVGTTPFIKTVPSVVTIHDIQFQHFPGNFVKRKRIWLKINVPYSIRSCKMVTVPSEWVATDIVQAFNADRSKVAVVPFGSTNLFPHDHCTATEVRARFRLDRPFLFYPARTYPHKNHRFLLEAFRPLAKQADLVLTGPPWFRDRHIHDAARRLGLSGKVRHLGMVSRSEIAGLYQAAQCLVYPTGFEGFGAPVLEAMSIRCPVIASNVTAIPEVAGDAAVLLDPNDLEGWTEMMEKLLTDEELRQLLISKGVSRALGFSWDRAAELQLEAYRIAISL